jgi:hypothetical protein
MAVEVELELKKVVLETKLQTPAGGAARPGSAWPRRVTARRLIFFCF